ncbi:lipoyl(octanoyl) transferase LipB [Leucobacter albus]|uniref:Octanoyltransferase n=1 Tax=Leucobacter albus TaxID=272210 RepID=A0ABW3THX4_9MICO
MSARSNPAALARPGDAHDAGTVLLLEHTPVYTAGRRAEAHEYPSDGTPVVAVNRGGKVTWHGPGQLVAYPVIRLASGFGGADLVRALEGALIAVVAEFGIAGTRVDGRTGVWTELRASAAPAPTLSKLAQIGIHVSRRIVTHGIALNCSNDLAPFANFVPCGITDAGVTTLSDCVGRTVTPAEVAPALERHLAPVLERFAV